MGPPNTALTLGDAGKTCTPPNWDPSPLCSFLTLPEKTQASALHSKGQAETLVKASGREASTHPASPQSWPQPPGHKSTWTEIISRINLALNSSTENVSTKFSPRRAKQN